jgi:hypothetical protein
MDAEGGPMQAAQPMQAQQSRGDLDAMAHGVIAHLSAGGEIVPAQMDEGITWSPERMLAAAVLVDALLYVREHHYKVGYQSEVTRDLAWIQSDDTTWPYSFVPLCHQLGLEPDFVRMVVRGWIAGSMRRDHPMKSEERRGSRKKTNARVLMIGRTTKTAVAGTGRRRVQGASAA